MAGDERGTGGPGPRPGKRPRPPMPDWEKWTQEVRAGLVAEGVPESEAGAEARRKCERMKLRHAWFRERFEAFLDMEDRAGEAYLRYMDAHPEIDWDSEDAPEVPDPPEAALAQAIYEEVMEAVREGRWPRHLHFRDV